MPQKTGILLINIGTPDDTTIGGIRRYLNEFLSDPRVIDLHPWARFLLVKCLILPFRPRKIQKSYRQIWTEAGSPLTVNSQKLAEGLQNRLGSNYQVGYAMRYGSPSLPEVLAQFHEVKELRLVPLYPQYASSSTATALARCYEILDEGWDQIPVSSVPAFFDDAGFIQAYSENIAAELSDFSWQHLLFSYHGLPERHLEKSGCAEVKAGCHDRPCPVKDIAPRCYRGQSYVTSRLLAKSLQIDDFRWSVSFQSRLGRTPWIKPYTDLHLPELYAKGIRNLAVCNPSFVADCLETLDEVGIRLKDQWLSYPDTKFKAIGCLNAQPSWIEALASLISKPDLSSKNGV